MERERLVGFELRYVGDASKIYALVVSGADLYAGGLFGTAGGTAANHIAKWNGTAWSALGSGMSGITRYILALAVSGSELYAGGWFSSGGGAPRLTTLPNGTGAAGLLWVRGWTGMCPCTGGLGVRPVCGRRFQLPQAARPATTLPNGMGAPGRPWARG